MRRLAFVVAFCACEAPFPALDATRVALRVPVAPLADPTLRPARLVPLLAGEGDDKDYGTEPGGGKRLVVSGVRLVRQAGGAVESATDALPSPPLAIVEVPARLGGGFLFAIENRIWRADRWLGPLEHLIDPVLRPTRLFIGLDRAYLRLGNGSYMGFDPRTGAGMDLGPWPASPEVTRYIAADGWRAVAIADLRGVVATFDAGARWQTLDLGIQARDLRLVGDAVVVTGVDGAGQTQAFAVQPNGEIAKLAPSEPRPVRREREGEVPRSPLAALILDGWPLEGGGALVARDGELRRVRLTDGELLDSAPDAFPLKPSRCHPLALSLPKTPAVVGFLCSVPHGATELYAYDARDGKLTLLRHFDAPRAVYAPGNGTLAVEGACDPQATPVDITKNEQTYCIMRKSGLFEDFVVNGDVGTERLVPLADGRTAILSPPVGDMATARLTVFDGTKSKTVPLQMQRGGEGDSTESAKLEGLLRSGTWLRGFEERRPNVLSGWVEHSGIYVGVEVAIDGQAKHGPFLADLQNAVVSGRYGLAWSPSRQGYETTDGGMSWKPIALPELLESLGPAAGSSAHGCGPLGCILAGWARVGWGATDEAVPSSPASGQAQFRIASPVELALRCELAGKPAAPNPDTTNAQAGYYYGYGSYYGYRRPLIQTTQDWLAFFAQPAPALGTDDVGFSRRTDNAFDHGTDRTGGSTSVSLGTGVARFYAWGPKGIEWDIHGRMMVRFAHPFDSSSQVHTSQVANGIPRYLTDAAPFLAAYGNPPHPIQSYALVAGDDGTHALLAFRRGPSNTPDALVVEIESERPVLEVHRADGQPLGELESAVRNAGRWYLATTEGSATVVWEVESGTAREVATIPRAVDGASRGWALHLARRADGRMIAALVDGTPWTQGSGSPTRWVPQTWALPIDVEAGTLREPEPLGASDGGNKTIGVCGPQDGGWVADGKWPASLSAMAVSGGNLPPNGPVFARYHVTPTRLCLEKASFSVSYGDTPTSTGSLGKLDGPSVTAAIVLDHARQSFQCVAR